LDVDDRGSGAPPAGPQNGVEPMPANWFERHPRAVALSLLGLLLAWAAASGLWIQGLRGTVRQQEEALAARETKAREDQTFLEESHGREVAFLKRENAYLTEQVATLRQTSRDLAASLARVTAILNESSGSPASASAKAELDRAMGQLARNSDEMSSTIEKIDTGEARPPEGEAGPASPSGKESGAPSAAPLVIVGTVASLALLGFAASLHRRNQELERREVRLNQREQRLKMAKPRPEASPGQS
jgi:hypothetical protein